MICLLKTNQMDNQAIMEIVSGHSIKNIIKSHWSTIFARCKNNIRDAILVNITKVLTCRTDMLGFHEYACPLCGKLKKVPLTCKSRFCSSCGKKSTDQWIRKNMSALPDTTWQHITFTMPAEFWDLFWLNRHLFKHPSKIAANIILNTAKNKNVLVGIYAAIHTFGRDLKRNVHIHLSVTRGGLNIFDHSKWINDVFFSIKVVMPAWRYQIITLLRNEYKNKNLVLPKKLALIKNYYTFNAWLDVQYKKTWVVHFAKKTNGKKRNIDYLGKYIKRPPLGETRIKNYDGHNVSFECLDHYTNTKNIKTLSAEDFIIRLITHIHDTNFRCIRYYGFLANRVRGKLLPIVHKLLNNPYVNDLIKHIKISWQQMIQNTFGYDPLECQQCGETMLLHQICFPKKISIHSLHQSLIDQRL